MTALITRATTRRVAIAAAVGAALALTTTVTAAASSVRHRHDPAAQQAEPSVATLAFSPRGGASGVQPQLPVVVTTANGRLAAVELRDPSGALVPGTIDPQDDRWTASTHLKTKTSYTVTAETIDANGRPRTDKSPFTTLAASDKISFDQVDPDNGAVVGVGMPIVLQFEDDVADKAAVQRSLQVISSPPTAGSWAWISDKRVDYRPQNYWLPGTKVTVAMHLDGVQAAPGRYGTADRLLDFTVGRDQRSVIDVGQHQMRVYRNGAEVQTMPVTSGEPGLDTWGGTMAVIDKSPDVHMDSRTVGLGDAYDLPDVRWAVHLTYSGTYVHAAPWSVGSQGYANVSHGCVGMSDGNAEWFYDNTLQGDVIQVVNSPKSVSPGNGFADWQRSWPQWLSGSAVKAG